MRVPFSHGNAMSAHAVTSSINHMRMGRVGGHHYKESMPAFKTTNQKRVILLGFLVNMLCLTKFNCFLLTGNAHSNLIHIYINTNIYIIIYCHKKFHINLTKKNQ